MIIRIGRRQAELTGGRIQALVRADPSLKPRIYYSTMTRAAQTAAIIRAFVPSLEATADDLLREGVPCAPVPAVSFFPVSQSIVDRDRPRIEKAFHKYVVARCGDGEATRDATLCEGGDGSVQVDGGVSAAAARGNGMRGGGAPASLLVAADAAADSLGGSSSTSPPVVQRGSMDVRIQRSIHSSRAWSLLTYRFYFKNL